MRDIKFRAFDPEEKIFVFEGFYMIGEVILFGLLQQHQYELKRIINWKISQFTGLKDQNGIDVYEGDRVKYQHSKDSREFTGTIHYKEDFASFWLTTDNETGFALLGSQKVITVIGNIHETF